MIGKNTIIRNAVISVFDKTGLDSLSKFLVKNNVNIFASSSTHKYIESVIGKHNKLLVWIGIFFP